MQTHETNSCSHEQIMKFCEKDMELIVVPDLRHPALKTQNSLNTELQNFVISKMAMQQARIAVYL